MNIVYVLLPLLSELPCKLIYSFIDEQIKIEHKTKFSLVLKELITTLGVSNVKNMDRDLNYIWHEKLYCQRWHYRDEYHFPNDHYDCPLSEKINGKYYWRRCYLTDYIQLKKFSKESIRYINSLMTSYKSRIFQKIFICESCGAVLRNYWLASEYKAHIKSHKHKKKQQSMYRFQKSKKSYYKPLWGITSLIV